MMRAPILYLLLVSASVCISRAAPQNRGVTTDINSFLTSLNVGAHHSRSKRDACDDTLAKTGIDPYYTCLTLLQPIQIDNLDATVEQVNMYCNSPLDCSDNIRLLIHDLILYCQGGGDPLPELTRTITEICDLDPRGQFCAIDFFFMFNNTDINDAYNSCLENFDKEGCTRDCGTITTYLVDDIGCCYAIWEEYEDLVVGIKQIDSKVFEACGLAEPKPCGTSA